MVVTRRVYNAQSERRATVRHDVSVRGAIILDGHPKRTKGCLIVDLSLGGAKVELDEDCHLPENVLLFESHNENVYECSVRWKSGNSVGLSFLDQISIAARRALIEEVSIGISRSMQEQESGD